MYSDTTDPVMAGLVLDKPGHDDLEYERLR
jgi:hypothetical protein